jgi:hypothetical protein
MWPAMGPSTSQCARIQWTGLIGAKREVGRAIEHPLALICPFVLLETVVCG